jgi:hypothetical protein
MRRSTLGAISAGLGTISARSRSAGRRSISIRTDEQGSTAEDSRRKSVVRTLATAMMPTGGAPHAQYTAGRRRSIASKVVGTLPTSLGRRASIIMRIQARPHLT